MTTNTTPLLDLEFIQMTDSLRGRAKSPRPRRQANRLKIPFYARITSFALIHFDLLAKFITLKGVLHRQRRHRDLQPEFTPGVCLLAFLPGAVEWGIWIHSFNENKPNLKNNKIGVSSFETSKYEILPAWRSKNQTQYKPNSNPIHESPKMNANPFNKMIYKKFMPLAGQKNKPEQTQFQTGRRPPYTPYLHHTSLKIYPKNASIINKLLIYTRFLIDNSIVSFTRYKDCEVFLLFENGEGF